MASIYDVYVDTDFEQIRRTVLHVVFLRWFLTIVASRAVKLKEWFSGL